jgi:hypothetical protein
MGYRSAMTQRLPGSPNSFPPGEEPEWVVGYEMTAAGWKPMDAQREAAFLQEGIASLENEGGIPHEQVMAELRALLEAKRVTPVK